MITLIIAAAEAGTEAPEWLRSIESVAVRVLTLLVITLLAAAARQLPSLAAKGKEWVDARVKNEQVRGVLDRLVDESILVVQAVEQSVVKTAKSESAADPKQVAADAKAAAMAALRTQLGGDAGALRLKKVLGLETDAEVEAILSTAIESGVHKLRKGKV